MRIKWAQTVLDYDLERTQPKHVRSIYRDLRTWGVERHYAKAIALSLMMVYLHDDGRIKE